MNAVKKVLSYSGDLLLILLFQYLIVQAYSLYIGEAELKTYIDEFSKITEQLFFNSENRWILTLETLLAYIAYTYKALILAILIVFSIKILKEYFKKESVKSYKIKNTIKRFFDNIVFKAILSYFIIGYIGLLLFYSLFPETVSLGYTNWVKETHNLMTPVNPEGFSFLSTLIAIGPIYLTMVIGGSMIFKILDRTNKSKLNKDI